MKIAVFKTFHSFPQYLQLNYKVVLRNRPRLSPLKIPAHLLYPSLRSIRHYISYAVDIASLNKPKSQSICL
jgi:hypothetical protein